MLMPVCSAKWDCPRRCFPGLTYPGKHDHLRNPIQLLFCQEHYAHRSLLNLFLETYYDTIREYHTYLGMSKPHGSIRPGYRSWNTWQVGYSFFYHQGTRNRTGPSGITTV